MAQATERRRRRTYDASGRRERAQRAREIVVAAARRTFLERGYAQTTIASVAEAAGVSAETIYKTFGGKPGLVRAVWEQGLAGRGATPARARSDAMSASQDDPRTIVHAWGRLNAEVSPLVSPILLLVRSAAESDPDLAAMLREHDEQRLRRMRHNARVLARRGFLRPGLGVERAAEIMWGYASPELYDLFVVRRGWTPARLGAFVGDALEAALLARGDG